MYARISDDIYEIFRNGLRSGPVIDQLRTKGSCTAAILHSEGLVVTKNDKSAGIYMDTGIAGHDSRAQTRSTLDPHRERALESPS